MLITDNGLVQQTQQTRTEIIDPIELIRYIKGTGNQKRKKHLSSSNVPKKREQTINIP